jgi:hypothetical protein
MSADNTVMILCTAGEYRVAHVQNAEDVLDDPHDSRATVNVPNWTWIRSYFDKARVFRSHDQALGYAMRLEEELDFVEYGIETVTFTEAYPKIGPKVVAQNGDEVIEISLAKAELWFVDENGVEWQAPLNSLLHPEWKRRIRSI